MIFDLHCDTLSELKYIQDFESKTAINLNVLKKSFAQCFAIFVNDNIPDKENYIKEKYNLFLSVKRNYLRNCRALLTIENCGFLENDMEKAAILKKMGTRAAGLIWNNENCIGYPAVNPDFANLPLKKFGFELLDFLEENGIIPDLAHINKGGFKDAVTHYKKPLCVTHSGAYSVFPHPRNLTDEQLRLIGKNGGIIGVCFYNEFLNGGARPTSFSDIIRHARHIKNVAGIESVALGSDYDGFTAPICFSGFCGLENALNSYFSACETEKICCKNAERLFA
ncbi:MAG: membrane dipeptidase [Clostridiales bacterium]|nr:membrane dipeptidase [Candidatus Equinaster intestinalis]